MRFAIADLELAGPLPELVLEPDQTGIALLLRRAGRPIHFSLHEQPPGARLAPAAVLELVGREAGLGLLEGALRDELLAPLGKSPTSLTVAICTRNRTELLAGCLRSLLALRSAGQPDFDVLVVDNDPPDGTTEALIASLPGVRYVREPRAGLDFARNRALAVSGSEFIAYLDDDVVVDHGWLGGLDEALAENPDAGAITGLVLPYELESEAQIVFERRGGFGRGCDKQRWMGQRQPENPLYPTGAGIFGAGCNMVLRRSVLTALGGFDEALDTGPPLPGGGDLDIFYRVIRHGRPLVYEPSMLVWHRHRRDHAGLRRQYWSWGEGFMAFVAKTWAAEPAQRPKLARLVSWWLGYELRELAGSLTGRAPHSPDLALAELLGGIRGLAGSYGRSQRRTERIRAAHA